MADVRIKDLAGTRTTYLADDFIAMDGDTQGSDKILLDNIEAQIRNGASDTQMGIVAGLTSDANEINKLDGATLSTAQLNYLAGVTAGTPLANKAIVLGDDKDGGLGRNLTVTGTMQIQGAVNLDSTLEVTGLTSLQGGLDLNGNDLILDSDANSKLYISTDDILSLNLGGSEYYRWDKDNFGCAAGGGADLGGSIAVDSGSAANAWDNLNLTGAIYMSGNVAIPSTTIDESCVIYMNKTSGSLMVKIQHGEAEKIYTLAKFV